MADSQGKKLTLYVDVISPFGYMAYWLTRHSPAFASIPTTYIPILLGGLMSLTNNSPPLTITNKKIWIESERLRTATALHIPMMHSSPKHLPVPTTNVQRVLCFLYQQDQEQEQQQEEEEEEEEQQDLIKTLDAFFHAAWVQGRISEINHPLVIEEILHTVFNNNNNQNNNNNKNKNKNKNNNDDDNQRRKVQEILQGMNSPSAKKKLRDNTDEAFRSGAFGLPWFVAEKASGRGGVKRETFWGVDSVGKVLEFLGVEVKGEGGRYKTML